MEDKGKDALRYDSPVVCVGCGKPVWTVMAQLRDGVWVGVCSKCREDKD